MADHLVLGHALITMVEPARATVAEYNRWYETDHFLSGVLTGPGAFAGRRFLATRCAEDGALPATSPVAQPVDTGSFLAVYSIEGRTARRALRVGLPRGGASRRARPRRDDHTHVSTAYYDLVGVAGPRPRSGAGRARAAPSLPRHRRGVVEGADRARHDVGRRAAHHDDRRRCTERAGGHVPPGAAPRSAAADAGRDHRCRPRDVLVTICFVDDDLRLRWQARAVARPPRQRSIRDDAVAPLLVAPFRPSVMGTDELLDQLW